jgi:hypothetical protein
LARLPGFGAERVRPTLQPRRRRQRPRPVPRPARPEDAARHERHRVRRAALGLREVGSRELAIRSRDRLVASDTAPAEQPGRAKSTPSWTQGPAGRSRFVPVFGTGRLAERTILGKMAARSNR